MELEKSTHFFVETLLIQVEKTLFSIPKYILYPPGTSFDSVLLPSMDGKVAHGGAEGKELAIMEGSKVNGPARLAQDITARQFTHFMSLLYTQIGDQSTKPSTFEDWMGVYKLASMGQFDAIREEAENAVKAVMSTKKGLDCIQLGRQYRVRPWVKWGLFLLVGKGEELDFKGLREGGLGIETICALYLIRESNLFSAFKAHILLDWTVIQQGFGLRYFVKDTVLKMIDEEVAFLQEFGELDGVENAGLSLDISPPWHTQDGAGNDTSDEDMGFGLFD